MSAPMPPPTKRRKFVGDYMVVARIGSGSYATVWKGVHRKTGACVAIKGVNREKMRLKNFEENLESEIAIMKSLQHPNIVQLIDVQSTQRHIYIILEFCDGGDLSQFIKKHGPMSESRARIFLRQLASGIAFLAKHNLIHRDLKPQNLLLTSSTVDATLKIADFGFARYIQPESMAATMCGSPLYMAPEILRYQKYDTKADLWSVGTLLYEMLVGRPPFSGRNHIQLLQNIETLEVRVPSNIEISVSCVSLLRGLLQRRSSERLSLQAFLSHPFLATKPQSPFSGSGQELFSAGPPRDIPRASIRRFSSSGDSDITSGLPSKDELPFSAPTAESKPFEIDDKLHTGAFKKSLETSRVFPQPRTNPFKALQSQRRTISPREPSPATAAEYVFIDQDHSKSGKPSEFSYPPKPESGRRKNLWEPNLPNESEASAIDRIEEMRKVAVLICSIAGSSLANCERSFTPAQDLVIYTYGLGAMLRARQAIRTWKKSTPHCSQAGLEHFVKLDEWLAEKFNFFSAKATALRSAVEHGDSTVGAEQLLYEHARQMARDAAVEELMGANTAALSKFENSRILLQEFGAHERIDSHDRSVLKQCQSSPLQAGFS